MPKFNPPEAMPFDAPSQWPEWRERFCRYRIATRLHKDDGTFPRFSEISGKTNGTVPSKAGRLACLRDPPN